ncbi:unnamed protein product [marine sediment metagenome]|uniref:PHA accumulation regulator DNA-binding N-terminal domain-containing protein n=1 Tax=marine sediment metagenome TaxID=412755 RepID=X1T4W4_9ZZZZ
MIIKKYKNRKYYCIDKSKFVVLNFIIGLIKRKEEFVIVNNRNDDITKQVILKLLRRELRKNAIQKEKKNIL